MNTNDSSIAVALGTQHLSVTERVTPEARIPELEAKLASALTLLKADERELVHLRNQLIVARSERDSLKTRVDEMEAALIHVGQLADDFSSQTDVLIGFAITQEAKLKHPMGCEHDLFPCPICHGYSWDPEYGVIEVKS